MNIIVGLYGTACVCAGILVGFGHSHGWFGSADSFVTVMTGFVAAFVGVNIPVRP